MISTICYWVKNPEEIAIITYPQKSVCYKWVAWNVLASSLYDFRFKVSKYDPIIVNIDEVYNILTRKDYYIILEETPEEKERFTQPAAEEMLSRLIFKELFKNKW